MIKLLRNKINHILHMLTLIKSIHSLIWFIMVSAIFYIFYAGVTDKFNIYFYISIALIIIEGLALLMFKGACPLTVVTRKIKTDYQEGDDIYLPRFIAINNRLIFTSILFVGLAIVAYRFIY